MQSTDSGAKMNTLKAEPEKGFLAWFNSIPFWQQRTLAHLYTMMTSPNTAYFALDGAEALSHFLNVVSRPDFPVRRVARLLQVRSVFSSLSYQLEFRRPSMPDNAGLQEEAVSTASHHWDQCAQSWHSLCAEELSYAALHRWLMQLS